MAAKASDDSRSPAAESTAAQALAAAGDAQSASDVGALDAVALAAQAKLGAQRASLVERLIFGPAPDLSELRVPFSKIDREPARAPLEGALACLANGQAFGADRRLSAELRRIVAEEKAYGFTVPVEFGGLAASYPELAVFEEELAANGLGALAVEISGELTIGAGSLQAYGTDAQKSAFLPLVAEGQLMGFGLTEVGVGVNAKKVQAYVEWNDAEECWRLFASEARSKLYITNATYGSLVGIVARIGEGGRQVGLFIVRLPSSDVHRSQRVDFEFTCASSGVVAFRSNHNSRLTFDNFPIPKSDQIQADGVEVLFYCLRMGRCMLAAMAAGYQRMFAADAAHYARERIGVGGPVIKHELPRLAIGKMLGGALLSRTLSHLSLKQDADGVDLAGLRDLTKSAAASTALDSLVAAERVIGGRSFDVGSRVSEARANIHVFGVVEGENDLILMGMVKDVTTRFIDKYLAGLLGVLTSINRTASGEPVARDATILRLTPMTFVRHPGRAMTGFVRLLLNRGFWRLQGWTLTQALLDLLSLPVAWIPARWRPRYRHLHVELRPYAKYAEQRLRAQRWVYLGVNTFYQLELTRTQIPLQRFGKRIELLVSILAICHHAIDAPESDRSIAALQAHRLRDEAKGIRILGDLFQMERLRGFVGELGRQVEAGQVSLLRDIEPQPFAHPWAADSDAADEGSAR